MGAWIFGVVGGLAVLALAAFAGLVVTMRTKNRRALRAVRRLGRAGRPSALRAGAGEPGSRTSVIHHVGRRSGRPYATPVGVYPLGEDFLVFLPYGPDVDWLRNVRAAGAAELRTDGRTYRVAPRLTGAAEALPHLSARDRWVVRLFGVTDFLVLERLRADAEEAR
ncbi:nitroreductase family deazaflavin-dependent oxidoreductase [Promicromonospora citrea]|uniref:Deazaflavin-dependent oxidoreductase (Nitroreductase family) n=1 Tax=Promicromonospora citrea TaxID=43677 RepID=A0A8H9GLS1_9MICO|nr:nitroreductase family deazaflavin-dependent oxidoreductase [Promicromonospora citrea]NNH53765.1 nitroreductase family deazaflavin-dependent oxidoreductase [Promicromonospora citrea]GGM32950.1 hypothetical protein GCM10010102_30570 [Promicromonospora citrea]